MEQRTSAPHFTTKDPQITAAQIRLDAVMELTASLETQVQHFVNTYPYSPVNTDFLKDFSTIIYQLGEISGQLSRTSHLADPERLRRVVMNSLQAQS